MAAPILAAALISGGAGAGLGAIAASSQNKAVRTAGRAASAQQQDINAVERMRHEQEAAQIRARMRVLAVDSGTMGVMRTTSDEGTLQGLLDSATSLFPASTPPDEMEAQHREAFQSVMARFRGNRPGGDPAAPVVPFPRPEPPGASLEEHMPWGRAPAGPGSWQAYERQTTMDLARNLHITDRTLFHELRKIQSGVAASSINPLMAALSGGMQGAQAGIHIAGAFPSSPATVPHQSMGWATRGPSAFA